MKRILCVFDKQKLPLFGNSFHVTTDIQGRPYFLYLNFFQKEKEKIIKNISINS